MQNKADLDPPVTTILSQHPLPNAVASYEEWLKEIVPAAQSFVGHQGVSAIRPHQADKPYTIVLHFDSASNLRSWLDSKVRTELIRKVRPLLRATETIDIQTGLEFWFTPTSTGKQVKRYKQFLLTLSAIFPLTVAVPWLLQSLLHQAPWLDFTIVRQLIAAIVIVGSMVYVIMPRYTRLVAGWLHR